jgi:hypothetical protein
LRNYCPEEWTDFKDIACGTKVLSRFIEELDKQHISKKELIP